ncbi:hypothetical protein [Methylocaldum szegediense]|uniref:hypothetical protein n=1 Tax=Methylocaldum szegediense TaxID=73780 RepID=UPI000407A0C5|nr:hypothetical protein [Methylocaldum szegediense]
MNTSEELSLDELEALINQMDEAIDDDEDSSRIETDPDTGLADLTLMENDEMLIASVERKNEIYALQERDGDLNLEPTPPAANDKKDKPAKKAKEKEEKPTQETKEKAPRESTVGLTRSEIAQKRAGSELYLLEKADLELDEDAAREAHNKVCADVDKLNVKVGAKTLNFLAWSAGRGKLNVYLEIGAKFIAKHGVEGFTTADLVAHFMSQHKNGVKSYAKSTAMPQATNIVAMCKFLKILKLSDGKHVANPDSLLFKKIVLAYGE